MTAGRLWGLGALTLVLAGCATQGAPLVPVVEDEAQGETTQADIIDPEYAFLWRADGAGGVVHIASGGTCQPALDGFVLTEASAIPMGEGRYDAICQYRDEALGAWVTTYLYPDGGVDSLTEIKEISSAIGMASGAVLDEQATTECFGEVSLMMALTRKLANAGEGGQAEITVGDYGVVQGEDSACVVMRKPQVKFVTLGAVTRSQTWFAKVRISSTQASDATEEAIVRTAKRYLSGQIQALSKAAVPKT